MNPTTPTPTHNPRYNLITQAAQTVNEELSIFTYSSSDDEEEDDNNNNNNEHFEREILFLRSSLEYFYANKAYPFATPNDREEFCKKYLVMSQYEYIVENERLRKRYRKRVRKICQDFELLHEPREQDAFDLGNRIWGSRSVEKMVQEREDQEEMAMLSAEEDEDNGDGNGNGGSHDDEEGVLNRFPFLKGMFKFGSGLQIPVVSEDAVKKGLASLGEDTLNKWNERWKKLQIEEMKNFLAQVNLVRHQTMTLLDELQNGAS